MVGHLYVWFLQIMRTCLDEKHVEAITPPFFWPYGMSTAGLNVDLDPFFELAELMMEMSQGTYGLLKTNN